MTVTGKIERAPEIGGTGSLLRLLYGAIVVESACVENDPIGRLFTNFSAAGDFSGADRRWRPPRKPCGAARRKGRGDQRPRAEPKFHGSVVSQGGGKPTEGRNGLPNRAVLCRPSACLSLSLFRVGLIIATIATCSIAKSGLCLESDRTQTAARSTSVARFTDWTALITRCPRLQSRFDASPRSDRRHPNVSRHAPRSYKSGFIQRRRPQKSRRGLTIRPAGLGVARCRKQRSRNANRGC